MNQPILPDGRMAKWILVLTLLLVLIGRLAAGQPPAETAPAPTAGEKLHGAAIGVVMDGHIGGRDHDRLTGVMDRSPCDGGLLRWRHASAYRSPGPCC